jgi:hypothetical protein
MRISLRSLLLCALAVSLPSGAQTNEAQALAQRGREALTGGEGMTLVFTRRNFPAIPITPLQFSGGREMPDRLPRGVAVQGSWRKRG